jgi:hypothetical protein
MSDPIASTIQGFIAAHGWVDDTIDEVALSNTDAEILAKQIRKLCADKACDAVDLACHGWISRPTPASIKRHVRKALEVSNEKDS